MPSRVELAVVAGPLRGKTFGFESHDTVLVGRGASCHIQLPDDGQVSRHHFLLEINPPDVRLRDLGSLNGTLVNGVRQGGRPVHATPAQARAAAMSQLDLRAGDEIQVGQTTLRVNAFVPATCGVCRAELAREELQATLGPEGTFICRHCREAPTAKPSRSQTPILATLVKPGNVRPICDFCGQDVSREVGQRRGHYVCEACRTKVLEDRTAAGPTRPPERVGRQPSGLEIEGYQLDEVLGKGGMGIVYQALRKSDQRIVAVKVMLPRVAVDDTARKLFLREIEVTRSLRHPNLVTFLESGCVGSAFYFVLEFCNGNSLDRMMAKHGGRLPVETAMPILMQCLQGLEYAHTRKFVHRDLKPANILLHRVSGDLFAKVSDFGLAKDFERAGFSGMTATNTQAGTYAFMAREQLTHFKQVMPVSDVWSLGATIYTALTGRYARHHTPGCDHLDVILNQDAIPLRQRNREIPEPLAVVIDQALLTDPSRRFQNAAEMRSALEAAWRVCRAR